MRTWIAVFACTLFVACSEAEVEPERLVRPSPRTGVTPTPSESSGRVQEYALSDVRLQKIRDPVPGVFWLVTFDARWQGSGPPQAVRCLWKMKNADGLTIVQGAFDLEAQEVDDRRAGEAYPDEIPGQPVVAEMTC